MTQEETKQREGTISAELWAHIEEILAEKKRVRRRGSGRPAADGKAVLEGILWVLHSGARWKDMPRDGRYPAYQTVHRTFQKWVELGIFQEIMARLVRAWERENKQKLLHEGSMDASFIADYLKALAPAAEVTIEVRDADTAILLRSGPSWCLVMPMSSDR